KRLLGLRHGGLLDLQVGRGGWRGQLGQVGVGLVDIGLGGGYIGAGAALAQLLEIGARLVDAGLRFRQIVGAGIQKRVELLLGVGQYRLGPLNLGDFVLASLVIADLRSRQRLLGAVHSRFGLHEGVVVLALLHVVELVFCALASRGVGGLRV